MLDRLVGPDVDEQGVDLDEFAGRLGLAALGQAAGVALFCGEADAPAFGTPAQHGDGNDRAASREVGEDAPDR